MSMTGTGKQEQDITGGINMYHEAELTDLRTTVANAIINALFLVPGNLPSLPDDGVDIQQYFYSEITEATSNKIQTDLTNTCRYLPGGAIIKNVVFDSITSNDGQPTFALIIRIGFGTEDTILGISIIDNSTTNIVRFNFEYISL